MPFTVAHAAAAWPVHVLARRRLDLSALIMGCLIPDGVYFVTLSYASRSWSHDPRQLLTFCLPAGLLVYVVFHVLVKRPLVTLLPDAHRRRVAGRMQTLRRIDLRGLAIVAGSVLLGAITHLLWDGFTHGGDWGVRRFPVLLETALMLNDRAVPWYKLLQWGSGVGGVMVLGLWYRRWYRRADKAETAGEEPAPMLSPLARWSIVSAVAGVTIAAGIAQGFNAVAHYDGPVHPLHVFAARAAMGSMAAFAALALAYGVVMTLRMRKHEALAQAIE